MPDEEDYSGIIAQLIAIWDADVLRKSVPLSHDVPTQVTVAIYGLAAHAVDCARGVLALYDAAHTVAAVPLIRTLFEDCITAGWILVIPDGWKSMWSQGTKDRAAVIREGLTNFADDDAEARRAEFWAQHKELGDPKGWPFEQRVNALDGTTSAYMIYRFASGMTHAGLAIVDMYMTEDEDSPAGVQYRRTANHSTADLFYSLAASSLLQTLIAWDAPQAPRRHKATLGAWARRLGIRNEWTAKP